MVARRTDTTRERPGIALGVFAIFPNEVNPAWEFYGVPAWPPHRSEKDPECTSST
jgi:hypothetical protein